MKNGKKGTPANASVASQISDELLDKDLLEPEAPIRLSTGVAGFDEVLYGGLIAQRAYIVLGKPGSGKTTFGLHFLAAGAAQAESTLFVTLGESAELIQTNAESIGIDIRDIAFLDLSDKADFFEELESYNVLSPEDEGVGPLTDMIIKQIEMLKPQRVFLDAVIQFRHLSPDTLQFRKQVLSFLRFLTDQGATVLFTSESSELAPDDFLQFISDGIISLTASAEGRTVSVSKFRGSDFRFGQHSMRLTANGMKVFPRLLPHMHRRPFEIETLASGIPFLDELLHGGLERGTITIISGPSGVGKTTLGLQFMKEAAGRGERSLVYTFEEWPETILRRCEAINMPVRAMTKRGSLSIAQVEPSHFSPDEFNSIVRNAVEQQQATIVMIDSVLGYTGYNPSTQREGLVTYLYALCKYLQNMGVAALLINEVESISGEFKATESGIGYMADNIVFLRYFEMQGEIRRGIGVLKKRLTSFERTMREIEIDRYGLKVGKPLTNLRGILGGIPEWQGPAEKEGKIV